MLRSCTSRDASHLINGLRRNLSTTSTIMQKQKIVISEETAKIVSGSQYIKKHIDIVDAMKQYQPKQWTNETIIPGMSKPMPISTELNYYAPLKHEKTHGHLKAEVIFKCYDSRNLEFFCDFALRAAYYLGMPVTGPRPFPIKKERWTVIKAPFAHAKTKENFQRHTYSRGLRIWDTNNEVIDYFLGFITEHSVWGVGVKANIYSHEPLKFTNKIQNESNTGETIKQLKESILQADITKADLIESPELQNNYQYQQLLRQSPGSPIAQKVQELLSNPLFAQYMKPEDMTADSKKEVKKQSNVVIISEELEAARASAGSPPEPTTRIADAEFKTQSQDQEPVKKEAKSKKESKKKATKSDKTSEQKPADSE